MTRDVAMDQASTLPMYLTLRCFYWVSAHSIVPGGPGWRRIDPPWILLNASPIPAPREFADMTSTLDDEAGQ